MDAIEFIIFFNLLNFLASQLHSFPLLAPLQKLLIKDCLSRHLSSVIRLLSSLLCASSCNFVAKIIGSISTMLQKGTFNDMIQSHSLPLITRFKE
jgi:hypothetical protein